MKLAAPKTASFCANPMEPPAFGRERSGVGQSKGVTSGASRVRDVRGGCALAGSAGQGEVPVAGVAGGGMLVSGGPDRLSAVGAKRGAMAAAQGTGRASVVEPVAQAGPAAALGRPLVEGAVVPALEEAWWEQLRQKGNCSVHCCA